MQILPSHIYSLNNITRLNISLNFRGNTNTNLNASISFHIPQFNFLCQQVSANLLFNRQTWDYEHSQFAYTTLTDVILKEIDDFDKYMSLSNGVRARLRGHKWNCSYVDQTYKNSNTNLIFKNNALSVLHTDNEEYNVLSCGSYDSVDPKYYHFKRNNSMLSVVYYDNDQKGPICSVLVHINTEVYELTIPLVRIYIHTTSCPPGFYGNIGERVCTCMSLLRNHGYKCDINKQVITSPFKYWTGYTEDSNITTSYNKFSISLHSNSPPDYCDLSFQKFSLNDSISDLSCLNNRTGILCGECKETFSAIFGSDACYSHCSNLYLLTLPLYALSGFILVVILYVLRLTVAVGTINGAIFYANVLGLTMDKMTEAHHGLYFDFFSYCYFVSQP